MKNYALIAINKSNSSDIYLKSYLKMPTLKQANKELKIRKIEGSKVIAIVETIHNGEIQYQSMGYFLKDITQ
jgi:hypothetical protein